MSSIDVTDFDEEKIAASRPLRVAILGSKGIPAQHGGIERHVEEIARRLVQRGHRVDVFTRAYHPFSEPFFDGVFHYTFKVKVFADFSLATEERMTTQVYMVDEVGYLTACWTPKSSGWKLGLADLF